MKIIQNNGIALKLSLLSMIFLMITLSAIVYFILSYAQDSNKREINLFLNTLFQGIIFQLETKHQDIDQLIKKTVLNHQDYGLKDINVIDKETKKYLYSSNSNLKDKKLSNQIFELISQQEKQHKFTQIKIKRGDNAIVELTSISNQFQTNNKEVFIQLFFQKNALVQSFNVFSNQLIFLILFIIVIYFVAIYLVASQFSILIMLIADVLLKFSNDIFTFQFPKRKDEFAVVEQNLHKLVESIQDKDNQIKLFEKEKNTNKKTLVKEKDSYQIDVVLIEIELNNYNYLVEKITSNTVMKINIALYEIFLKELDNSSGQLINFTSSRFFIIFRGENRIKRAAKFIFSIQKQIIHFLSDNQYQINNTLRFTAAMHSGVIHYSKFNYNGIEKSSVLGKHRIITEKILKNAEMGEIVVSGTVKNELSQEYSVKKITNNIELEDEKDIKIYSLQNIKSDKIFADLGQATHNQEEQVKNVSISKMIDQTFNDID